MRKAALLLCLCLCTLAVAGCGNDDPVAVDQSEVETAAFEDYSPDYIYGDGVYSDLGNPLADMMKIYPAEEHLYSLWSEKCVCIDFASGYPEAYSICRDPLCNHSSLSCIEYASSYTDKVFELDGTLYFLTYGEDMSGCRFTSYDLTSGKITYIADCESGASMLTSLGRFVYYYSLRYEGETEAGQSIVTKLIYRYDIKSKELLKLSEFGVSQEFFSITGHNGSIYYLDSGRQLICRDANMQNAKAMISGQMIETYTFIDDYIIYFVRNSGNDSNGSLYKYNLTETQSELLYENVTWFCCDDDVLYYSLYNPIVAFEWEFPLYNSENGEQELTKTDIIIKNGNRIYMIPSELAGKSEGEPLVFTESLLDSELFIGERYAVYNGFLYTQSREAYSENNRLGMKTGLCGIDLQTGEAYRLTTEYVMYR